MQHTLEGIILRQYKTDKADVLHILTAQYGVITAFVSSAKKKRGNLAAATELLCYCSFVLFHNRDKYFVDKADANRIFFSIREDIEKLALASYLAQLADEVCPHGVEAGEHLRLLLNTLHYIEKGERPAPQLKALFELRLLTLSGYMPNLVACRECACYESDDMRFFPASGDLLCGDCLREAEGGSAGMAVPPGVLAAMRHIIYAQPEKLFSFSLSEDGYRTLARVSEQYLQYQIEKTFTALEFYRSLQL